MIDNKTNIYYSYVYYSGIMNKKIIKKRVLNAEVVAAIIFIAFSIITSILFYFYLTGFHAQNLKQNLVAIAKTASLQINGDILQEIQSPEDMEKPEFKKIVAYLDAVRNNNQNIRYIYLMRKTSNPDTLSFIVDADSLKTEEELDENNNGLIDINEEISYPGDLYNASHVPALKRAFIEPTADEGITIDQWGKFISGYAPIYNSQKEVVAIIGVDLKAEDYYRLQNRTNMALYILISIFSLIIAIIFILIKQYKKEIKILEDVDRQKSDFISLASHQLRTPLSASKWGINMLQHGDFGSLGKEQKKAIADLCIVNEQMVALVNDLLKVSQTDSADLIAKFRKIHLKTLCDGIINELQFYIAEKNIKFKFSIDDKIKIIKSDPDLLKDILLNLLSNAFKYTPSKGFVSLDVQLRFEEIIFEIKDTGYGIPKDEQKRIFTKFFRAENILRKEPNGTGLGLYFVKKVVELLGGRIDFSSVEGKGTTFYFYLPYKI